MEAANTGYTPHYNHWAEGRARKRDNSTRGCVNCDLITFHNSYIQHIYKYIYIYHIMCGKKDKAGQSFSTSFGWRLSWPTGRGEQVMFVTSVALTEHYRCYNYCS